jgi:glycosyltransferase involved in cell wall biosynthesis
MHILFLSHYFPPEVNAPASRTFECARVWAAMGHKVTVVTKAPSHPHGRIYPGFANSWTSREEIFGIDVIRIWTYLAANKGVAKRILNFISYPLSVFLHSRSIPRADIVISSSPQFFAGLAGWLLKRRGRPWVLEIRDLYPESIRAVGLLNRGLALRFLEWVERQAYRRADAIVSVTDSFVPHILERRGAGPIEVIKNGVDLDRFVSAKPDAASAFRRAHGLEDKFVTSYIGTHGMAQGLDTVLDAAAALADDQHFAFLLVGDGAERQRLLDQVRRRGLANVTMLGQQARNEMPTIWSASDASVVLLKDSPTFRLVIPSKIFEAMAMRVPILLGVEGEARKLVEAAGAGIAFPPERSEALVAAIRRLADDPQKARAMGESGRQFVAENFDRNALAVRYAAFLEQVRCLFQHR